MKTSRYQGVLKEIHQRADETIEELAKRILDNHDTIFSEVYNTYMECLVDEHSDEYVSHNKKLFKIISKEIVLELDMFTAIKHHDELITYDILYGKEVSFHEALHNSLDNITEL